MPSLTIFLALATAHAVDREVPNQYPTAQGAVAAAQTGDRIVFTADVVEDWSITGNRTLTVTSTGGAWVGQLTVSGGAIVTVEGITLRGGQTQTDPGEIEAGNFCVDQSPTALSVSNATLNVLGNTTMSCYSEGAIKAVDSDVRVEDSIFQFNYYGAAIFHFGGDLTVLRSRFEFNSGGNAGVGVVQPPRAEGGAIRSEGTSTVIRDSKFNSNSLTGSLGAGVFAKSDTVELDNNEFLNNYNLVWFIPGIVINDPEDLFGVSGDVGGLVNGLGYGAGVYVVDPDGGGATDLIVHDNTFCGNLADSGSGLYVDDIRAADIRNNRFADNWAMHFGGGMYIRAFDEWTATGDDAEVVNNTFVNNTAGIIPPPFLPLVTVIGGGGHAAFDGTVVDFRNNIAAFSDFGGAIMGIDGNDYIIGDYLTMDYNIFYWNCDDDGCPEEIPEEWQDFTGDLNQISLPATNIALDPFPTYFGEGEFNCVPDAFYPEWGSPAVRNGDAVNEPNQYSPNFSDIGAYGGPGANVLDRDGDGFENIYDCNDESVGVFPGAPEQCDQLDNDCDGVIDEDFDTNWYIDNDGDSYGDVSQVIPNITCNPPANHVTNRDDCNDADAAINPAADEICNGLDDDCDFAPDGGLPFLALWADNDNDDYGGETAPQVNGCPADGQPEGAYQVIQEDGSIELVPSGLVQNNTDCNDFNANISPVALEVCDGNDNDCNGIVDDAQQGGQEYFTDGDGDGFGAGVGTFGCEPPDATSVTSGGDCDDFNPEVSPGVPERCDDIDNDCDGSVDTEAEDAPQLYEDLDNDGIGNDATARRDCNPGPTYTASVGGDCDDNDPTIGVCGECGCQATPTPGTAGGMGLILAVLLGARRRRD